MRWFALMLLVLAGAFAGCKKDAPPPPADYAPVRQPGLPTEAQPKLPTIHLWLGAEEVVAEMALTPAQEQAGLMFRTNMDENAGMIFVFGQPVQASFWMKNCPLALSCAYIEPDGSIAEIHEMQPNDTNAIVAAAPNVEYVLEMNQGWFGRHHIEPATLVRTQYGTLQQTFLRQRR